MKYDDASWHYGAKNFPAELPQEAGATHTGMFVSWALLTGLAGELHLNDLCGNFGRLKERSITPGEYFLLCCDGKFTNEDLNEMGNHFAQSYFNLNSGQYIHDYESTLFSGVTSVYAIEDSWENYDRLKPVLDRRYKEWYLSSENQTQCQAKADCGAVMNSALPFARKMLEEHGEFFPVGSAMRADGQTVAVAGYDGNERPSSADVIRLIKDGFIEAARRKEYRATALVYDVKVKLPESGETSDAIAVSLNHRDFFSLLVLFPYRIVDGKPVFGAAFSRSGDGDIFVPIRPE
jgi:hypothetical protein